MQQEFSNQKLTTTQTAFSNQDPEIESEENITSKTKPIIADTPPAVIRNIIKNLTLHPNNQGQPQLEQQNNCSQCKSQGQRQNCQKTH